VGGGEAAMGYLWASPLYSPESPARHNKILWFVRYPRDSMPLRLAGHLVTDPRRTVSATFPANSSPGEIYPSYVTVPEPGCWSFTLRWGTHVDRLSLPFAALPHKS
jgi:hypothetical protein